MKNHNKFKFSKYLLIFYLFSFFIYLFYNTGIHSDDYTSIQILENYNVLNFFLKEPIFSLKLLNFLDYYLLWWPYIIFEYEYLISYDIIKALIHILCFFFIFKFASNYLPQDRAVIFSLLFLFYPTHETTLYWYQTLHYTICPSILLYAHCLLKDNNYKLSIPFIFIGSFFSYSSPPYVFGLGVIFLFEKEIKKSFIFFSIGLIYIFYYNLVSFFNEEQRIDNSISILDYFYNVILQIIGSVDVNLGPSFWIKMFYAYSSVSLLSILISFIIFIFLIKNLKNHYSIFFPKSMFLGLLTILLLSFLMFSLTGKYNQVIFNLGNRVTIYSALFFSLIICLIPMKKLFMFIIIFIFLLPVLGLSNYWKEWNNEQLNIIENINQNMNFNKIKKDDLLLIENKIYSKIGPFNHIEFFSQPWVVKSIFHKKTLSKNIYPLTNYNYIYQSNLFDTKYETNFNLLNFENIFIYDANSNKLSNISIENLQKKIKDFNKKKYIRHWYQLVQSKHIRQFLIKLSPRLDYLD